MTPIDYDVEKPQSYQVTDCQSSSNEDYSQRMYGETSDTGTSTPSIFDLDKNGKCQSRVAV